MKLEQQAAVVFKCMENGWVLTTNPEGVIVLIAPDGDIFSIPEELMCYMVEEGYILIEKSIQ